MCVCLEEAGRLDNQTITGKNRNSSLCEASRDSLLKKNGCLPSFVSTTL